ncbi:hypothetical protein AB0I53_44285 [Saccharopolyspora sp. NPDC050389]|uniref:hypothetical protein n=1 Tax=Saccharopolyspora sp. NPDC050389 TaxID=3155516 RepID=UPI0033EBBF22
MNDATGIERPPLGIRQGDWVNSRLAARLPAVVVSVEHYLRGPGIPLSAAIDDDWTCSGTWCRLPGVVPQAKAARVEIAEFLRGRLAG